MAVQIPLVPNCRYGHGPLGRVDHKGEVPEWGLRAGNPQLLGFSFLLSLYVCKACGYAELFDLDPETTHDQEVSK